MLSVGDCDSFEEKMEGLKIYFNTETLDLYRRKRTCLLELACRESNIEIVRYLLSIGIDSNRINNALEECMFRIYFYGHDWNCATLLLENGGDVNHAPMPSLCYRGRTLLSIAVRKRNYEMVQNLCEKYSAKINEYDILYCFDFKRNIDEGTKIAEFLIRKCDIGDIDKFLKLLNLFVLVGGTWTIVDDKFWRSKYEIDDYIFKKVMDMIVKEQKRRKQENIRNLLLIGYRKRPELHQDELREIASFL